MSRAIRGRRGSLGWLIRLMITTILVIFALSVIFGGVSFDAQAAGTDLVLRSNVDKIDGWCGRNVDRRTMTFDLSRKVQSVTVRQGTEFVATMSDGSEIVVPSECSQVSICAAGGNGRGCTVGGRLPGGTFEAVLYFDGAQVIIDPPT